MDGGAIDAEKDSVSDRSPRRMVMTTIETGLKNDEIQRLLAIKSARNIY